MHALIIDLDDVPPLPLTAQCKPNSDGRISYYAGQPWPCHSEKWLFNAKGGLILYRRWAGDTLVTLAGGL